MKIGIIGAGISAARWGSHRHRGAGGDDGAKRIVIRLIDEMNRGGNDPARRSIPGTYENPA